MFRESASYEQLTLFDRYTSASSQAQKAISNSRAKMVGDYFYPEIDEQRFKSLFSSDKASRPNIEIKKYVSALLLERLYGLTDANFFEFLRCGALNFQYALHTTSCESQPLSERSLARFRKSLREYNEKNNCDLLKEEYERISRKFAIDMGLLPSDQNAKGTDMDPVLIRMDSMQIEAHAKAMGRIEILYVTNMILIRYLLKKDFAELIPSELQHYLKKGDENQVIYYHKTPENPTESTAASESDTGSIPENEQDKRVAVLIREMLQLKKIMDNSFAPAICQTVPEYQVLIRVLGEQTISLDDGKVIPKKKEDISPDSVQNPFDTTVSYRYKYTGHHGEVLNVAEAHDENGNGIIIQAEVRPNTASDDSMAKDFVNKFQNQEAKTVMEVDGAYSGEEFEQKAAEKNIEVIATSLTGKEPDPIYAEFELNEKRTAVVRCPKGYTPVDNWYSAKQKMIYAEMPDECCSGCPHRDICKAFKSKRKSTTTIKIRTNTVRRAKIASSFDSEKVKKAARNRNAVEGIMAVLRRKYHLDEIPVFGIPNASTWIWNAIMSYNLVKYQKFLDSKKCAFSC